MEHIFINVGPLNSFASLGFHISEGLSEFNENFIRGRQTKIIWNLNKLEQYSVNMSTLTAFLSVAYRLRKFSNQPQEMVMDWKPPVLAFLTDVSFFKIAKELDLFTWDSRLIGGFQSGKTNPNTEIFLFENQTFVEKDRLNDWIKWKDSNRQDLHDYISSICENIFNPENQSFQFPQKIVDTLSSTATELALNSVMHGREPAFIGAQRTSERITVSVCDCGVGFINSLRKLNPDINSSISHIQGILIGSIINKKDFGLQEAIQNVLDYGGWVIISSYNGEICYRPELWHKIKNLTTEEIVKTNVEEILGSQVKQIGYQDKLHGYWRQLYKTLRGTRITFEIPV